MVDKYDLIIIGYYDRTNITSTNILELLYYLFEINMFWEPIHWNDLE